MSAREMQAHKCPRKDEKPEAGDTLNLREPRVVPLEEM